ncbi:exocyst complex component EXO70H1-like [Curcuma longa]|uniref:exocyst complex component EXO70H1-like n=1 Tax=Curcuma longa TaxID=136217 RepID=UPI003D9EB36E
MARKSLRSLFPSYSFGRRGGPPESSPRPAPQQQRRRVSDEVIEKRVAAAEVLVARWDRDVGSAAVLFCDDHRAEARAFLAAVGDLQLGMLGFVSGGGAAAAASSSSHAALVRAQSVMQAAMRRLEKEFHRILADNRYCCRDLEAVSVRSSSRLSASEDGEDGSVGRVDDSSGQVKSPAAAAEAAAAMGDLRAIAETMVSAGYSKECVKVYKLLRKSVVDEELRRLKFDSLASNSQVRKLDWAALEIKIQSWLYAARAAFSTLFSGERILLEHVFAGCDSIRDAVFGEIANDAAVHFLRFPEAVAKSKPSMDKTARFLDLYDAVSELLPEVDSLFTFESTSAVREQALASRSKLGETIRATVADFEEALLKENSKFLFPGGGVHPFTRRAMEYIAVLADYETSLAEIFDESHTTAKPLSPSISEQRQAGSEVTRLLAPLMLALHCKLDAKAAAYRDAALSHLFLANNFQHVANRARACSLSAVLGEEWAARQEGKARQHAEGYERAAWGKVAAAVPAREVAPGEAREHMRAFGAGLEAACAAQEGWVVADARMREDVRAVVRGMILPAYRRFHERWRSTPEVASVARFSPEEVGLRIADLFTGSDDGPGPNSYSSYRIGHDSDSSQSDGSGSSRHSRSV